jgi:hypothetical protein
VETYFDYLRTISHWLGERVVQTYPALQSPRDPPAAALQREACEACILSQKHEGWQIISTHYDDGGFSGGNTERPALKRLMTDIHASTVNTVVVYKDDRLTRSLADFAKIIEQFDEIQDSGDKTIGAVSIRAELSSGWVAAQ